MQAGGAGASHNACLHIDSIISDDVIILLTVFEMLLCVLSALQGYVFMLPFCYTAMFLSCCEILF